MPRTKGFSEKKCEYVDKLKRYLTTYDKMLFVNVDNVQSQQMHNVRKGLRGKAEVLMGKNTLMRRVMKMRLEADDVRPVDRELYEKVVEAKKFVGNVGIVFTNEDFKPILEVITKERVQAPARVGSIAPVDVIVKAGDTGMEPTATSFFQALGIQTKIAKGKVEIVSDQKVCKAGDKVDNSVATLLQKLGMKPFFYGLQVELIFDKGEVYGPEILNLDDSFFDTTIQTAVSNITGLSLGLDYPTAASYPHALTNAFKDLLAISLGSDFDFPEFNGAEIKKAIKEGRSLGAAAAPAAAAPAAAAAAAPAAAAAKAPEPAAEEGDDDMGFGLFD